MKKLTTAIAIGFGCMVPVLLVVLGVVYMTIMVSCKPETQQQRDAFMAKKITEINYKGHRYLLYNNSKGNRGFGGLTHNPECPCHKKYE